MPHFCLGRVATPQMGRRVAFSETASPGSVVQGACDGTSFTLAEGQAARGKTRDYTLVKCNLE
jgi:hypothetical protein